MIVVMSPSILIPVLMCSILQFDMICSRNPVHPCGYSKIPIAGPACFLYYDCTFPGERNLVSCPLLSVFNENTGSCAFNYSAWFSCLLSLNTKVNMNSFMKLLNTYMTSIDLETVKNFMEGADRIFTHTTDSNPCSEECQKIHNVSLCIIPYDNCTGYYNCSNPLSVFNNCKFNEKFDEFKRQCVVREYASCGVGSSYPAEENKKLRFCTESQMNECSQSNAPIHNCVYSTKCLAYEDCSRSKVNRYVNCSEQHNNSICNILFPSDCERLPELLDEITNVVSISTERYVFKEGDKAEFTCETNLTSIERFVWLLDKKEIKESERTTIVSQKDNSKLTISSLTLQDTGLLMCSVEYGKDFHQADSIYIMVYHVPQVTIIPLSQTLVKEFNSSIQFTCGFKWSTMSIFLDKPIEINWFVNGAHVSTSEFNKLSTQNLTFTVSSKVECCVNMSQIGLVFSPSSYVSVVTDDDELVLNATSHLPFTTTEEPIKLSTHNSIFKASSTVDMSQTGFISSQTTNRLPLLTTEVARCKHDRTVDGLEWNETKPGENFTHPCPSLSSGKLVRICLHGGHWSEINEDECYSEKMDEISDLIEDLSKIPDNATKSSKLANLTQQLPNVSKTNNEVILSDMSAILFRISSIRKELFAENGNYAEMETESVLNSTAGVIQSKAWINNSSMRHSSLQLIQTINVYSSHHWKKKTFKYSFFTDKLEFERNVFTSQEDEYIFAQQNKLHKNQIKISRHEIQQKSTIPVGASVMQNVANALMNDNNSSRINSDLISMNVLTEDPQLVTQFTLHHLQVLPGFSPLCVFWVFNGTLDGYWSSEGCKSKELNDSHTTCECSHLTNFAILFSPSIADAKHDFILGIISQVGCSISIVALILTIIIYAVKWRILKSKRAVLLVSLCVSLIIANIIFLAGVDKTSNPAGCTAVSALLHYFFLSSFFMMLMLALHLFISVFFVFFTITKTHVIIMITSGWLLPLFIVAISLAATNLRGYGNDRNCWLSLEFGVLWAFVGPALVIIITNMIIAISVLVKICQMKISRINMKRSKWLSAAQNLVVLNPILGLTWIFGVLSVDKELVVFQYIFAVINSLQGLFIFLLHGVCLKKSLSSQTRKTKDEGQLPSKFTSSKARIQADERKRCDEYYILNSGTASESSTYKPSTISSYSFSTDATNFSSEKY